MSTDIIPFDAGQASQLALAMKQLIVQMMKDNVLVEGVHYGTIPGTSKPTLYKPGAEYLASAHKLYNSFTPLTVIEDWEHGFFVYRYECKLIHRETGEVWGVGNGSCNSMESKYRWRWVSEDQLPTGIDTHQLERKDGRKTLSEFGFAIDKAEIGGQYGKTAEHWQMFQDAIANGTAKSIMKKTSKGTEYAAYEITVGATSYRIPNNEPYDLVNTIDKMAQKRALIAATLIATNASEFFTQDLEDFAQSTIITVSDAPALETAHNADASPAPRQNDSKPASAPKTPETGAQGENQAREGDTLIHEIKVIKGQGKNWYLANPGTDDIWFVTRDLFKGMEIPCEHWTENGVTYPLPRVMKAGWQLTETKKGLRKSGIDLDENIPF